MNIRSVLIAIFAAVSAVPAGAQPGKDEQAPKVPPSVTSAPVVLASAGDVRQPTTAPVRRPAPRVTTCRCGDPQATPDQPAEEQPDR